ncbi:MAG: helix-turn-helix domain-containing protein [Coraliomargarita sp.]
MLANTSMDSAVALFDELSDVLFWVKDASHRIAALNRAFAERVKLPRETILGQTDADLYYPELAQVFMEDDRRVFETGEPMRRKIELLTSRFGGVEWRSTTKLPVWDPNGQIIGTTGISRPLPNSADALPGPYRAIGQIVEYARGRLSDRVTVMDLAREAGMSIATLERRFREHLRLSPSAFLAQLRVTLACELLRDTPLNMTEIALECGYESPAAFSRAFRREMDQSPSGFRGRSRN